MKNRKNYMIIFQSSLRLEVIKMFLLIFLTTNVFAQKITQKQAIERAWQHNLTMKITGLETDAQRFLVGTAKEKPKTAFQVGYGRIQVPEDLDYTIAVSQTFNHPKYYKTLADLLNKQVSVIEQNQAIRKSELAFQIKQVFAQLCYQKALKSVLIEQDSVYKLAKEVAIIRRQEGEESRLEVVTAESEMADNYIRMQVALVEEKLLLQKLHFLLNISKDEKIEPEIGNITIFEDFSTINLNIETNPLLLLQNHQKTLVESEIIHENTKKLPDFSLGITNQTIDRHLTPVYVVGGINIPLSSKPQKARIQSLRINEMIATENQNLLRKDLENQLESQILNLEKFKILKNYYEQVAMPQDKSLFELVNKKYRFGQALYHEYITLMQKAWENKEKHLQNLLDLKQTINEIEFLTNQ